MIERMKKVTILTEGGKRNDLLLALREAGVLHISDLVQKSPSVDSLEKERGEYARILQILTERGKKRKGSGASVSGEEFQRLHASIAENVAEEERLKQRVITLQNERERILPFGDFDPAALASLADEGIPIYLYTMERKEMEKLRADEKAVYIPVAYSGKGCAAALLYSPIPEGIQATPFRLPSMSLFALDAELMSDRKLIEELGERIEAAAGFIPAYKAYLEREDSRITFEKAASTISGDDIVYLSGYIPEKDEKRFRDLAAANAFAFMIDDPGPDDNPPTLVQYKGIVRIVKPVFDILGTVPGYHEYDISSYFLVFFSLFFAMIIGDAGYGLIFILVSALLQLKTKKLTDVNILIYVLGGVTVIWGALTGTWFGSEAILVHIPFLQKLIVPAITNFPGVVGVDADWAQNMLMKFCFILGAVQLGLGRVINIVTKARSRDLSLVAEIGWFLDVVMLYLMALYLVIGEAIPFNIVIGGVALGFVLVCCFSGQGPGISFGKGLVSGLSGFFTTFLDTISCFSNIMSYIRLFAVGMASLAIAQSFNDMAGGMLQGFMLPIGILIILVGHALNFVMGILSVVVHGVRLNLLEFSGSLGMEWTGYNYDPFRKTVEEKNTAAENS